MTASYLGSFSVGASIPGAYVQLESLGVALAALRDACLSAKAALDTGGNSCSAQGSACISAKTAIRIPAVASPEASLNAAINFAESFGEAVLDPAAYVTGLLSGLAAVQSSLSLTLPSVAVDTQLDAAIQQQASFGLQVEAIDAELDGLVSISGSLDLAASALFAASAALQVAIDAANTALTAWLSYRGGLAATGAHCLLVQTTVANVGAELQGAINSIGIGAAVPVKLPVVLVEASNAPAISAMDATFRVS